MMTPALIIGVRLSSITMRMLRSTMLEVLRQDYVRTAWAKGLRERSVIVRHVLKNAFIPVITVVGSQLGFLFGGVVIIETIFNLPGPRQVADPSDQQPRPADGPIRRAHHFRLLRGH